MPIATPERSSCHSSSASGVASMVAIPLLLVAMIQAVLGGRTECEVVPNPA